MDLMDKVMPWFFAAIGIFMLGGLVLLSYCTLTGNCYDNKQRLDADVSITQDKD